MSVQAFRPNVILADFLFPGAIALADKLGVQKVLFMPAAVTPPFFTGFLGTPSFPSLAPQFPAYLPQPMVGHPIL